MTMAIAFSPALLSRPLEGTTFRLISRTPVQPTPSASLSEHRTLQTSGGSIEAGALDSCKAD